MRYACTIVHGVEGWNGYMPFSIRSLSEREKPVFLLHVEPGLWTRTRDSDSHRTRSFLPDSDSIRISIESIESDQPMRYNRVFFFQFANGIMRICSEIDVKSVL